MYIDKYWGSFIGGSDDSLNLVAFLEDQKKEEIPLSEIFAKIGLDRQNWNFQQTAEYLEFTHSDGVEMDFHFAIDVVTDLAAILLECSVSGSVNLQNLDEYNMPSRCIRITATPEEHDAMNRALADFVQDPLSYDISEMMGEDEITDMAYQVEMLRKELYEDSGSNRNYHVKAEDVKHLLPDWEGADGCIATGRITVEGCKVGYCYREEPDGGWDSGWRFTASDESEAYMNDPNNAGIYKLNTICNDDPDIIPLLNTPAPCAFERDENGVFQQIKDWKSDEDKEETDMDYIPYTPQNEEEFFAQLEQWNDEDQYTRCIQALNAVPEDWQNYRTSYALARALENYAVIGDHGEGTPNYKGDKALIRAIKVLESVRKEGENKAEWNMRMAYGYQYLCGQEEKAIPYAQRWAELDPADEDAQLVLQECRAEIRKRRRSRNKKVKFVPGDTPFEGFDLTNFWDDNWYALKEYVSDPPSDELIASVEEELGYKLPAVYIWLMKQHNGGIPVNTCYPCNEPTCWAEDHVAITGIFGIGREKIYSLCGELGSQFMIDEWEYPAIGVAICDCPSAGHDMIFLDYRACGPQGEPAVVHVDQENDYKITHLADSFEEFIRGLEHESLYDPDDDAEDFDEHEDDDTDEVETVLSNKGSFAGSVLLSKAEWDKEQLIRDLQEEWGIMDEEPDEGDEDNENSGDIVMMRVGGMMLIVTLFHGHIPDNEAEMNAENNYMWPEAVEAAKAHRAHIMVAVLGEEEKLLERGRLFTKAMAVCCRQKYATGVYTSGVVFEPRFYEGFANMMKEDELPIFNWIWFGLYRSEGGLNGYTYGMDVFGKEEMEVLNADAEPEELRDFLASLASYVLACDVTLKDGETIGFSADDKHAITRGPGVSLPEEQMTLKISYESAGGELDEDTLDPSDAAQAIMEYLDCECTYFPSMADDDPIMSAYSDAKQESVKKGFVPVLIQANDETLLECLVMNADPENDADCYEFDLKTVEEYRKKMLAAPVKDGKAVLEALTGQRREEAEDDDMDWEKEVLGEMKGGYDNCRFSNYWDSDTGMTHPLILARIPVKNPWEIFAYLPFGNWNECPDTPDLMAVAKYWFEQYGAVPAAMSHDELEFELPAPVSREKAMEAAAEQYGFCPDIVDQEQDDPTVGNLADVLWQSTIWYFWWD